MDTFKKRELFEVIFDTCSSGKKVLDGIQKLVEFNSSNRTKIFQGHRFIIPLQIGIETKRRIFPDFLIKELESDRDGHLERFYKKNKDHIKVVETDISRSFKLFFAVKSLDLVGNDFNLKNKIIDDSLLLLNKYYPEQSEQHTKEGLQKDFEDFRSKVKDFYKNHKKEFSETKNDIESYNYKLGIYNEHFIQLHVDEAERKKMARTSQNFFKESPLSYKLLLQSMYSNNAIHRSLSTDKSFSKFRMDKGERAIDDYLFKKRAETNKDRVTLVISEDRGARKSIQHLRKKSENTIFAISSFGFAKALKSLNLINKLTDVVDQSQLDQIEVRRKKTQEKIKKGHNPSMNDIIEPEIEEKWAERLAEVVRWGYWEEQKEKLKKHNRFR